MRARCDPSPRLFLTILKSREQGSPRLGLTPGERRGILSLTRIWGASLRRVPKHPTRRRRRERSKTPGSIRVLIADDHRLFLDGITGLLKRRGFAVVGVAADGEEAVAAARATQPDVALLDVAMPKVSGLDATRALLTDSPGTAVVLVTGRDDQAIVLEGMALGVRGFVFKSVATEELVDAIR